MIKLDSKQAVTRSILAKYSFRLACFLFLSQLALLIWTFRDYGITYDEDWRSNYGESIIQWYASGFRDQDALTYSPLPTLPLEAGLFEVVARLATRVSPWGVFETSHFVNAIFGLLALIGVYRLGKYLGGPFAGLLSVLFLMLTPRFYGNAFNDPVDVPFATLSLFFVYLLVRSVHFLPNVPKELILELGVVLGLAFGVRIGAVILVGCMAIAFSLWLVSQCWVKLKHVELDSRLRSTVFQLGATFFAVCATAYLVMLIWWPAAQVRPIVQPAKALAFALKYPNTFNVFFEGRFVPDKNLPWYYVLKWFVITLPEFYFGSFLVGIVFVAMALVRSRRGVAEYNREQLSGILVLLVLIGLTLGSSIVPGHVEYDGLRHFLFVIPLLAVIAGISIAGLVQRTSISSASAVFLVPILASLVITCVDMVQLHPDEYVFFNRLLAGGLAEAANSYETDYWGNSYKEGVDWLVRNFRADPSLARPKVGSCSFSTSTSYYLPQNRFEYIGSFNDGQLISSQARPDLFLATTRWNCHKNLSGTVLHIVERQGVPLLYVIRVSEGISEAK